MVFRAGCRVWVNKSGEPNLTDCEVTVRGRALQAVLQQSIYIPLKLRGYFLRPLQSVTPYMPEYRFTCPSCDACATVDGGVRERLLAVGCPVCAGEVDTPAFVEITPHNTDNP